MTNETIVEPNQIRFARNTEFERELVKRVNAYFQNTSKSRRDNFRMYLKSFLSISWVIVSYCLIVFAGLPWWGIVLSSISLSFALNAKAFSTNSLTE